MKLLELTLPEPAANLALDEALLLAAEESGGPEVLRLWESPRHVVVVGAGGSVGLDVNRPACEAAGVPILRRASGGGTVLLGPGCLCFSLILRTDRAPGLDWIQPSTKYVLNRNLSAIRTVAPEAVVEGTSDLAMNGLKFSGSAQQRKRRYFLHHGTLLFGFELGRVSELLSFPERQPEYRRSRPHGEFLMNLPTDGSRLARQLIGEWKPDVALERLPEDESQQLVESKYTCAEWTFRR